MIKIIISGTSDGFYPRYASDGVLDDEVSQRLLDRRRFLSRDADRLNKEGYSFQPLEGIGVLFHKLILLYDGFGRDGFMMASLFLPKGEVLEGNVIKEALDAVIREYKMHIVGGMANVELDWSFVKRKADEVNTKVRLMPWKKHLSPSDSSRTALIKGADNRVAEYFQFPNPLHPDCTGFGQVFLTESLLDPAMVSDNGEQGYKVIDVDIDNPIYEIHYNNPNGYSTFGLEHEVSKKKLDATDPFFCGTIKQSGFRELNVFIPADKKNSLDGITLEVDLPSLIKKEASVFIQVLGSDTTEIPWENCTINWKSNESYSLWENRIPTGRLYYFEKEECDRTWKLCVECDQYEKKEAEVEVNDRDKEKLVTISLRYNPTWTIVVTLPNKEESYFESQDKKDGRIIELISSLKGQGLEVDTPKENRNDRTVELKAKYPQWTIKSLMGSQKLKEESVSGNELEKRIEEWKRFYEGQDLEFEKREDSERIAKLYFVKKQVTTFDTRNPRRENVFLDPTRNENVTKSESPKELEKKKWVLQLDEKSKKYSIFKNCEKKAELAIEAKQALGRLNSALESFSNIYKNSGKDAKTVDYVKGQIGHVIDELPEGTNTNLKNARKHYDNVRNKLKNNKLGDNQVVVTLINCADDAIKTYGACLKIPPAIVTPKNVIYDYKYHRLIVEQEPKPDERMIPEFRKDHYSYSFVKSRLNWADDSDFYATKNKHEVVRKLQPRYKFLWFVLPLLVIGAAIALCFFVIKPHHNGDDKIDPLKSRMIAFNDTIQNNYHDCYCGSELLDKGFELKEEFDAFIGDIDKEEDRIKAIQDSVYRVFNGWLTVQDGFKEQDATNYAMLEFLNDSINTWNITNEQIWERIKDETVFNKMIAPPMSKVHTEELMSCYSARLNEETVLLNKEKLEELKKAEQKAYKRCFEASATTATCDVFLKAYKGKELFLDDFKNVKEKREELDGAERNAEQSAYEACMKESATLQALKAYLSKYKNDSRFKDHVTAVNNKRAEMERNSSGDTGSKIIEIKFDDNWKMNVFNSLTWEMAIQGQEAYYKKYNLEKGSMQKRANDIIGRATKKKMTMKKYNNAYQQAIKTYQTDQGDILTILIDALDKELKN